MLLATEANKSTTRYWLNHKDTNDTRHEHYKPKSAFCVYNARPSTALIFS